MKFFKAVFLIIPFISDVVLSQNYYPFSSIRTSHYYSSVYNSIFSFRPDSVSVQGSDTAFYNHKQFGTTENNNGDYLSSIFNSSCLFFSDTSWAGLYVSAQSTGDFLFFNKNKDTIIVKTQAKTNESWILFRIDDNLSINALVTKMDTLTFIGVTDSVKYIHFTVRDSLGNNVPHALTNKEIILSKNHGAVNFYDMLFFPEDASGFTLVGHTNPETGIQNLTGAEIYNFEAGDEIHIKNHWSDPWSPWYFGTAYTRKNVLNKVQFPDSLVYSMEIESLVFSNSTQVVDIDTSYSVDTVQMTVIIGNASLNQLTFEPMYDISQTDQNGYALWNFTAFCGKQKRQKWHYPYYSYGNTWGYDCWNMILMHPYTTYRYIDGLGGYYSDSDEIVYYKKTGEECGTPIDFQSLLNAIYLTPGDREIKVFYSRDEEVIKVISSLQNFHFELYDVLGNSIFSKEISSGENIVAFPVPCTPGIYFYSLKSGKKTFSGKIPVY